MKAYTILDKTNLIMGAISTIMTVAFGKYWMLFVIFLFEMFADYVSGWAAHKFFKKDVNSNAGAQGIIRKVAYMVCIAIAFLAAYSISIVGTIVGINAQFVMLFGWFTLATFMINEFRSIMENLEQMGVNVPEFLIYGFEVVGNKVNSAANSIVNKEDDNDANE